MLVVPFLQRLPTVEDHLRLSLVVYTVVVIVSGLLAIYYLALNRETRLRLAVAGDSIASQPGESA